MRSHSASASSMSCVVRRIVASWSRCTSRTNACTSRLLRGSRPVVGSSSSISTGDVRNARATAIFCCWPRDSSLTIGPLVVAARARAGRGSRPPRLRMSPGARPYTRPKNSRFSSADICPKNDGSADTRLMSVARRHRRRARRRSRTRAPRRRRRARASTGCGSASTCPSRWRRSARRPSARRRRTRRPAPRGRCGGAGASRAGASPR